MLGDPGFLIEEDVANCCTEFIIFPAFTRRCKQLSKRDIDISIVDKYLMLTYM